MNKPIKQIATHIFATACMFAALCGYAQKDQVEDTVKLMEGSVHKIEPSFSVERFLVGGSAVRVLDMPNGLNPISVRAEKVGIGDVQLIGANGVTAKYRFLVNDKGELFSVLRRLLEPVPSVEVTAVGNQIVIEGTVSDPDQWRRLIKVTNEYKEGVSNYAKFQPPDEWLMQVQQGLEAAGYNVVPLSDRTSKPTGTLKLGMRGNSLYVSGVVFNTGDIKRVRDVVSQLDWVELPKMNADGKEKEGQAIDRTRLSEEGRILAIVNVSTKPSVLVTVDVAVLAVDDQIINEAGVNLFRNGLLTIDGGANAFANIIHGRRDQVSAFGGNIRGSGNQGGGAGIAVGTSLNGTLEAFGGDRLGRKITKATVAPFESGDPAGGCYQLGGTLKVRLVAPAQTGPAIPQTGGLEDIDYGLIVKTSGDMIDDNTMSLKVDFELSYPIILGSGDFDLKKNKAVTQFGCGLGKTMILGGVSELAQNASEDGVPYLKSVPVLGYFFGEKKTEKKSSSVLVLISPRLVEAPRDGTIDINEIRNTEQKAGLDASQRMKERTK